MTLRRARAYVKARGKQSVQSLAGPNLDFVLLGLTLAIFLAAGMIVGFIFGGTSAVLYGVYGALLLFLLALNSVFRQGTTFFELADYLRGERRAKARKIDRQEASDALKEEADSYFCSRNIDPLTASILAEDLRAMAAKWAGDKR